MIEFAKSTLLEEIYRMTIKFFIWRCFLLLSLCFSYYVCLHTSDMGRLMSVIVFGKSFIVEVNATMIVASRANIWINAFFSLLNNYCECLRFSPSWGPSLWLHVKELAATSASWAFSFLTSSLIQNKCLPCFVWIRSCQRSPSGGCDGWVGRRLAELHGQS
jgi:hypothetical protein